MDEKPYDLFAAKLAAARRRMIADLNADLFRVEAVTGPAPKPRPLWRVRLDRAKGYLATLWMALKGEDPYDCDCDGW